MANADLTRYPTLSMHDPVVITDGGPWVIHDVACAVCRRRKAILDIGHGRFLPCGPCMGAGWELRRRRVRPVRWLGRIWHWRSPLR
jgi:hypothetical protein